MIQLQLVEELGEIVEEVYIAKARAKLSPSDHGGWFAATKHLLPKNFVMVLARAYQDANRRGTCAFWCAKQAQLFSLIERN
jgi:hypothetical protein